MAEEWKVVDKQLKNGRWIKMRVKKRDDENADKTANYDLCPVCSDPLPPGRHWCPTCGV